LEFQFASSELQRLYTDNVGAEKYTAETVRVFRRRIRHIEAAKDLQDLQSPGGVRYRQLTSEPPLKSAFVLNESWLLVIAEHDHQGAKEIVILEICRFEGIKG
jgi:plasmid maintenance system killer protein